MKRSIGYLLAVMALGPILPLYFLKAGANAVDAMIDWMVEGRAWVQPFVRASQWVERKFKIDADTEHDEWRARMRAAGKFDAQEP